MSVTAPDVEVSIAVDGAALLSALKVLKAPVLTKGRGQTVRVESGEHAFTLKTRLSSAVSLPVDLDGLSYRPVGEHAAAALLACAQLSEENALQPHMTGVRFTPSWVGGATQSAAWLVWEGFGDRAITVDYAALRHLNPDGLEVGYTDRYLVLRSADRSLWSLGRMDDYPDGAIEQLIAAQRDREGRAVVRIDVEQLRGLCTIATAAQQAPAEVLELRLEAETLSFTRPEDDHAGYYGSIACPEVFSAVDLPPTGISPATLGSLLALCVEPDAAYYLAVGGPRKPVVLWGGSDPAVEAVLSPGFLPGSR